MSPDVAHACELEWKAVCDPIGLVGVAARALRWPFLLLAMIGLLVSGLLVGPRVGHFHCFESRVDIVKLTVGQLANEAFPRWASDHPGRPCPMTIFELAPYMDRLDLRDRWGNAYTLQCLRNRAVITSAGEDGKTETADDIRSDD